MKRTIIVVFVVLAVLLAGCGGPGDAPENEGEEPGGEPAGGDEPGGEEPGGEPAGGDEPGALIGGVTSIALHSPG